MKSNIGYSSEQVQTIKVNYAQSLAKEVIEELEKTEKRHAFAIHIIKQKFNL